MSRSLRLFLVGLVLVTTSAGPALAQYYHYPYGAGYRGYGFGGWSSSNPVGDIARGYGAYAAGQGAYNYQTAQANSINADTVMRYNQYIYNADMEGRRQYAAYEARTFNHEFKAYNARQARIFNNPGIGDIESGDALNAIMTQLTEPVLMRSSASRLASLAVSSSTIRGVPFRDETDAITLSLDRLTDAKSWPSPLRADAFKSEREAYQKAVDDALAEDKEGGTLKPETVARVRATVTSLYTKVAKVIPMTQQPDHVDAMNYLSGLAGLSKMLEKSKVEAILADLEKIQTTNVANLIAFMQAYNLRFAPASTPKERAIYGELYAVLDQARKQVISQPAATQPPGTTPPPPPAADSTALFHGMDPSHLYVNPPSPRP